VQVTPTLHPLTEVTPPVGAAPVETPNVKVSYEITPPQSIHYHLKMRNAIPSFTDFPLTSVCIIPILQSSSSLLTTKSTVF